MENAKLVSNVRITRRQRSVKFGITVSQKRLQLLQIKLY